MLEWRPARAEDESFLDELYEGTRWDEVLGWGFDAASARAFLREQGHVQRRAYAMQYPAAEHRILLSGGVPVGRLIVDRTGSLWAIVDASVLTARRSQGIGTWAISEVQRAAAAAGNGVLLHVDRHNRARSLYARLGFREQEHSPSTNDPHDVQPLRLEWRAP